MSRNTNLNSILQDAARGNVELAQAGLAELLAAAAQMIDVELSRKYLLSMQNLIRYVVLGSPDFLPTRDLLSRLHTLEEALKQADSCEEAYTIAMNFFPGFLQELRDSSIHHLSSRLSGRVIHFIRINYHQDLSVEEIAERLALVPRTMCSSFKRETDTTVHKILSQIRLTMASERLLAPDEEERKIAADVGYRDLQAFRKAFRLYFGISPYQYRKYRGQIPASCI